MGNMCGGVLLLEEALTLDIIQFVVFFYTVPPSPTSHLP